MNRIDQSKPFKPVHIAVLTVSDTRTLETDKSGDTLVERIARDGHVLADRAIVTDDVDKIRAQVKKWIDDPEIEVVITHRRHRRHRPRRHARGAGRTVREAHRGLRRDLPLDQLPEDRHLDHAVARHGGRRQRHLHLRAARLDRRLQGRLGRHPAPAARHPLPALQLRRADAAPQRRQDARAQAGGVALPVAGRAHAMPAPSTRQLQSIQSEWMS